MKALCLDNIGALRIKERPLPSRASGEVLLRVTHCAICRTDAKMWKQGQRDLVLPRILGHEICGYLIETGERFVAWPGLACGVCSQCKGGRENLCKEMRILGFHRDGGFCDWVAAPRSSLIPVPDNLPGYLACLTEPMACAINALEQSNIVAGQKVLIYGGGTLGLMIAIGAHARGARPFVVEKQELKLKKSEALRKAFDIPGDLGCSSTGFDVAINAAPDLDTLSDALGRLAAGACFCLFSGITGDDCVPVHYLNEIHYRQLHLTGAYGCTRYHMECALHAINEFKHDMEQLIDDKISLEEVAGKLPQVLSGELFKIVVVLDPADDGENLEKK